MTLQHQASGQHGSRWDPLIAELRDLRTNAGSPSFQSVTDLVVARRITAGSAPASARLARSTVYDTFRLGRPRVNLDLVREIAAVLGADTTTVEGWIAQCQSPPPSPPVEDDHELDRGETAPRHWVALLLLGCLVLNLLGREFVDFFHLPVYLDMTGTAIAAIALGPWRGAAVGVATNVVGVIGSGLISLPFALVNVVGALVWGYGVRRFGMGRSLARFFLLNVVVALACTVVSVPIILTFLGHDLHVGRDVITRLIEESISVFPAAVSFSNGLTSMGDKLISGFVALVVVTALPWRMRRSVPLVLADQADHADRVSA